MIAGRLNDTLSRFNDFYELVFALKGILQSRQAGLKQMITESELNRNRGLFFKDLGFKSNQYFNYAL